MRTTPGPPCAGPRTRTGRLNVLSALSALSADRVLGLALVSMMLGGCEELGPDAKGEIATTALQTVGDERTCIPLDDMASAQPMENAELRVVLRDGTDWRNDLRGVCPNMAATDAVVFVTETGDACASDQILLVQRSRTISRLVDTCTLGRFVQR